MGLKDALEFEGFRVLAASDGKEGLEIARKDGPDAIILDLMLPGMNGYTVCQEIRRWNTVVPILMLTARSQEIDKIRGLDVGADDYVTKPFSVNELIARIRALLRRASRAASQGPEVIQIGDAQINLSTHTVESHGAKHELSFYEAEILRLLFERQGTPVSRDEIMQKIWGHEANATTRTIDNFVVKLRKKLEKSPDKPEHILTVYGYGYKLTAS